MMKRNTVGVLALLSAVGLVAGCGSTESVVPLAGPATTSVSEPPTEAPPGDPGSDAPEAPDPGEPTEPPEAHPARTAVPAEAMLDPDSVGQTLGST